MKDNREKINADSTIAKKNFLPRYTRHSSGSRNRENPKTNGTTGSMDIPPKPL